MYSDVIKSRQPLQAYAISSLAQVALISGGVLALAIFAHLSLHLPWTPVPITLQTFGVTLLGLSYGRRLAVSTVAAYLALGSIGLPLFAGATVATSGYLGGMVLSAFAVGTLSDGGWSKTLGGRLAAGACGSILVYTCGIVFMALYFQSFYIHDTNLFALGVLPFIPGDILKTTAAALIAKPIRRFLNSSQITTKKTGEIK